MPGGDVDRRAGEVEGVADHLRRRLLVPGHHPDRFRGRPQVDVAGTRVEIVLLDVVAGDGQAEDRFRDPQSPLADRPQELRSRQDLAARDVPTVRHNEPDLADTTFLYPGIQVAGPTPHREHTLATTPTPLRAAPADS